MRTIEITSVTTKNNKAGAYIEATVTGLDLENLRNMDEEAKEVSVIFDLTDDTQWNKFRNIFWSKKIRKEAKTLKQAIDQAVKDNATIWIY